MEESKVQSLGGNQYEVIIGEKKETVDLDGFNVMSDEDYEEVEKAGLIQDDMICPKQWDLAEEDYFFKAALEHAANYSGFIAANYIKNINE